MTVNLPRKRRYPYQPIVSPSRGSLFVQADRRFTEYANENGIFTAGRQILEALKREERAR